MLAQLGQRTFELIELLRSDGVEFDLYRQGLLVAAEHEHTAVTFLRGLEPLRALGYRIPNQPLQRPDLQVLEPALSDRLVAGFVIDQHWHVHPESLMNGLAHRLRDMGVALEEGAQALELHAANDTGPRLRTTIGDFRPDAVVLSAGAWTPGLARTLGLGVPVQPGKGYSFELPFDDPPRHALLLLEAHVGYTPLDGVVRVAGTMEFSGVNARLDQRRVDAMVHATTHLLRGTRSEPIRNTWVGMRPIAPDGLPIIGASARQPGVYLATGYAMLGMTLAAPAAEALARLILTGERPSELEPFRLDRFARHGWLSAARRLAQRLPPQPAV